MTFLVLGSNSFSGSNFVSFLLKEGFDVIGVSRSEELNACFLPYKWEEFRTNENFNCSSFLFKRININTDLKDLLNIVDEYKPEYIVNFAAQGMVAESWLNPTHWYETNLLSQVKLHDNLRKRNFIKKYLHVTTPEVYGSTDNGWIKESFNFLPSTPYAVSRAACDLHLRSFFEAYDFPVVFTRAANVYGPGQQLYRIIPRTILSCLSGKSMELHGGGKSIRSFIHIDDCVSATLKIVLRAESGSSWHLSTDKVISIHDLVQKICELTNTDFKKIVNIQDERLGKDSSYLLDSNLVRERFNWSDQVLLNDGLKNTILWVEKNFSYFSKIPWNYIHKL